MSVSKRRENKSSSIDWTATSMHVNAVTSDVVAPSSWQIFGCQNGTNYVSKCFELEI